MRRSLLNLHRALVTALAQLQLPFDLNVAVFDRIQQLIRAAPSPTVPPFESTSDWSSIWVEVTGHNFSYGDLPVLRVKRAFTVDEAADLGNAAIVARVLGDVREAADMWHRAKIPQTVISATTFEPISAKDSGSLTDK